MTQAELADQAKMDRSFLSDVERGTVAVSIDAIERIANTITVPIWSLFKDLDVEGGPSQNMRPGRKPRASRVTAGSSKHQPPPTSQDLKIKD